MRKLAKISLDKFVLYAIKLGIVKVNESKSSIFDTRLNRNLKQTLRASGYYVIRITIKDIARQARVNRVIAINHFGIKNIINKQVAHLDKNKKNNKTYNLKPMFPREHLGYDENLIKKTKWKKCKQCRNPNGTFYGKHKTPERINGLCRKCYMKEYDLGRKDKN